MERPQGLVACRRPPASGQRWRTSGPPTVDGAPRPAKAQTWLRSASPSAALWLFVVFVVATVLVPATAYCPNNCNSKGECGPYDVCTCVNHVDGSPAWTGADCSLRTCPMGTAFVGAVVGANNVHPLAECSNKGECSRSTGQCTCYKGAYVRVCPLSRFAASPPPPPLPPPPL